MCALMLEPISGLSLSPPPLLIISSPAPHPPEKRPMCGVGKCVSPSLLPIGEGGVATKEIPKVPLQWHRRTVWKLACPLMVQHILAHQKIIRNPWNPPSTITIMIFSSFVNWSPWHGIWRKGITSCSYKLFLVWFFFAQLAFQFQKINQNVPLALDSQH